MTKLHFIAFVGCIVLVSCTAINKKLGWSEDSLPEEIVEEVLETAVQVQTGYRPTIDLTPGSPE